MYRRSFRSNSQEKAGERSSTGLAFNFPNFYEAINDRHQEFLRYVCKKAQIKLSKAGLPRVKKKWNEFVQISFETFSETSKKYTLTFKMECNDRIVWSDWRKIFPNYNPNEVLQILFNFFVPNKSTHTSDCSDNDMSRSDKNSESQFTEELKPQLLPGSSSNHLNKPSCVTETYPSPRTVTRNPENASSLPVLPNVPPVATGSVRNVRNVIRPEMRQTIRKKSSSEMVAQVIKIEMKRAKNSKELSSQRTMRRAVLRHTKDIVDHLAKDKATLEQEKSRLLAELIKQREKGMLESTLLGEAEEEERKRSNKVVHKNRRSSSIENPPQLLKARHYLMSESEKRSRRFTGSDRPNHVVLGYSSQEMSDDVSARGTRTSSISSALSSSGSPRSKVKRRARRSSVHEADGVAVPNKNRRDALEVSGTPYPRRNTVGPEAMSTSTQKFRSRENTDAKQEEIVAIANDQNKKELSSCESDSHATPDSANTTVHTSDPSLRFLDSAEAAEVEANKSPKRVAVQNTDEKASAGLFFSRRSSGESSQCRGTDQSRSSRSARSASSASNFLSTGGRKSDSGAGSRSSASSVSPDQPPPDQTQLAWADFSVGNGNEAGAAGRGPANNPPPSANRQGAADQRAVEPNSGGCCGCCGC